MIRRFLGFASLALLSVFLALPALAADAPKWQHAPQELIATFTIQNAASSDHTAVNADIAWAYWTSPMQEVGTVVTVLRGDVNGYALGPRYELNFPSSMKGNAFLGGDAQWVAGAGIAQLTAANLTAAARAGYKWYVGNSSALRIQLEMSKAVNATTPGNLNGNPLNVVGLSVGFSVGLGRGTTIQ